jgi:hypothetical protein
MNKLLIYFAVLIALCVVTSIPDVALLIIFVTLGLGIPLLLANTLLLYSFALLPLEIWRLTLPRRWSTLPLYVLPVALLAVAPGQLSKLHADASAQIDTRDDVFNTFPEPPRVIEIASSGSAQGRPQPAYVHAPCDETCQRLLFSETTRKVRITKTEDNRRTTSVTYSVEQRDHCPEAFGPNTTISPAVRQRIAAGTCVLATVDDKAPADALVTLTTWHANSRALSPIAPSRKLQTRQIAIVRNTGGSPVLVRRQTEVKIETLTTPFIMWFENSKGMDWGPPGPARWDIVYGAFDVIDVLARTFGAGAPAVPPLPQIDNRALVERALSRPADDRSPMTVETISLMDDYLLEIAKQPRLEAADVDLVRRLIADPRVENLARGTITLFGRHPNTAESLIPEILNRIAIPVPEARGHYHSALSYALLSVPTDKLRPHSAQIFQILRDESNWHVSGLLLRVGELDGDAVGLITERLRAKSDTVRKAAVQAACRADPSLDEKLKPILVNLLQGRAGGLIRTDDFQQAVFLALTRHGGKSEAFQIINEQSPDSVKWVTQRLGDRDAGFPIEKCRRL